MTGIENDNTTFMIIWKKSIDEYAKKFKIKSNEILSFDPNALIDDDDGDDDYGYDDDDDDDDSTLPNIFQISEIVEEKKKEIDMINFKI
jgi:hypothetical protein